MVREQALVTDQGRKTVFVLKEKKDEKGEPAKDKEGKPVYVAMVRDVGNVGVLRDGYREVEKGIEPGDWVVVAGHAAAPPGDRGQAREVRRDRHRQEGRREGGVREGQPGQIIGRPRVPPPPRTPARPRSRAAPPRRDRRTDPGRRRGPGRRGQGRRRRSPAPDASGAGWKGRRAIRGRIASRSNRSLILSRQDSVRPCLPRGGRPWLVPRRPPRGLPGRPHPRRPRGASHARVLPLLHRPPDLRHGAVDRDHARRRARAVDAADRDVSADRAADGAA